MKPLQPFDVSFSGVHLIEASAGTGKTYNIASLYVRAVIETDKTVDEILVVTFTKAATKELRDRLMRRLRESIQVLKGASAEEDSFLVHLQKNVANKERAIERLQQAVHSFDEAAVYTIHAFCQHALQEWAFESGAPFEAELIGDDSEILTELIDDCWRNTVKTYSDSPVQRPLLKFLLDKGYGPEKLAKQLKDHFGKPYLEVCPEKASIQKIDERLKKLANLFEQMGKIWPQEKAQIRSLLLSEPVSGRRFQERYLNDWIPLMDDFFQSDVIPILWSENFSKFSRFSQSYINESLKKSSIKKGIEPPKHPFFKLVDAYINIAESLKDFDVYYKRKLFGDLASRLNEKKEELQVYSYDDVLVRLGNALMDSEKGNKLCRLISKAYPIALVDEFQDTDPIQYQIFKTIYEARTESALFMIGDPKQSIYGFRGADIFAYLQAKKNAMEQKRYSLSHNYRSVPGLIEAVNTLFGAHPDPFILEDIPFHPVKSGIISPKKMMVDGQHITPVEIRQLSVAEDEYPLNIGTANDFAAADTADQIQQLLESEAKIGVRKVEARDIAVLVRSHFQATIIKDALAERGIKSVTQGRESVFRSEEARELYTVLKAVVELANERLIATALSTSFFSYDANTLFSLQLDESAWVDKVEQFAEWHSMWQNHGFSYMLRSLMQQENIAETVIQLPRGERTLTNLIHLGELMQQQEQKGKTGMHSLLKWLLRKSSEDAKKDNEEEQLRLESDENLVSIVTIHQSKGLEYPIVFCPFLWYVRQDSDSGEPIVYHDPEDDSQTVLDFRGKNDPERSRKRYLKAREALAEEVRLAYVAITRAQYKCIIHWAPAKQSAHSPLGFLLLSPEQSFKSLEASVYSGQKFDESDPELFQSGINKLAAHSAIEHHSINAETIKTSTYRSKEAAAKLRERLFNRPLPLPAGPGMASFSSLIRNRHDNYEDDFITYYEERLDREEEQGTSSGNTIFDFPKGPNPGTAVHHIFENIAFDDRTDWRPIIQEHLREQDIDSRWTPVVHKMINATVNHPLKNDAPGFSLSSVERQHMMAELEFYFTTGDIRLREILEIIRPEVPSSFSLDNISKEGFLKGFIDLTFEYEGRYYILDYKTNFLGNSKNDYKKGKLFEEIKEAFYDVQYHLYIVALHRFLKLRLKKYRYEKHMGGAFYLFVRGINKEGPEGIFYDRPAEEKINKLNAYLEQKS